MMVRRAISFHVPSSGDKKRQSSLLLHNMRQLQVRAIYSLLTSNHSGNHISVHFTHIKYVFNIIFTISQLLKLRPYTWTLDKEAPAKGVENLVVVDQEEEFTKATDNKSYKLDYIIFKVYCTYYYQKTEGCSAVSVKLFKKLPPPLCFEHLGSETHKRLLRKKSTK